MYFSVKDDESLKKYNKIWINSAIELKYNLIASQSTIKNTWKLE